jgi:TPR repeat protein
MRSLPAALAVLLLGGAVGSCGRTYWTKDGFNQTDWNRDTYECERDMRQSGYYGTGLVGVINAQEFFERCLIARGYYRESAQVDSAPMPTNEDVTEIYRQACDRGEALSCYNLGVRYDNGTGGLQRDAIRAAALYGTSCDHGVIEGCFNLALMYANGDGVTKDVARATDLYRKACDAGDADSCANLKLLLH